MQSAILSYLSKPAITPDTELAYRYKPLSPGPWIRILRLEQGYGEDPVKGSLCPRLLDNVVGEYDALSYVWGPEQPLCLIEVDGKCLAIRKNLFDFLKRIRSRHKSLDLWADAICVDQKSTGEKNHQVQQMQAIYRSSRTTRVWLGLGSWDVDRFLRWNAWISYIPELDPATSFITNALNSILDNQYWRRLWIVQEVILSPDVDVYLSQSSFSWADFIRLCKRGATALVSRSNFVEKLSRSTMLALHRQRTHRIKRDLPEMIRDYRTCRCFDLRDRVFGLLGLVDDFTFKVDYALSRMELFEQVMRAHPPQFAEDLAQELWAALEVSLEICSPSDLRNTLAIPVRAKECGCITRRAGKLAWSHHPTQILVLNSYHDAVIDEGETFYSLSSTPVAAARGTGRFLILLRGQRNRHSFSRQSSSAKQISYTVSGTALVFHSADPSIKPLPSFYERPLSGARVFRDIQSFGYGPLTVEISIWDFAAIFSAYGFRLSDQAPHYDGGVYLDDQAGGWILVRDERDDHDEAAIAIPVAERKDILISAT